MLLNVAHSSDQIHCCEQILCRNPVVHGGSFPFCTTNQFCLAQANLSKTFAMQCVSEASLYKTKSAASFQAFKIATTPATL